jgi:RelB antitoxin.
MMLFINEKTKKEFQKICKEKGLTMSSVIKLMINKYIEQNTSNNL